MKSMKNLLQMFASILTVLVLSGCGAGQIFGPTVTPLPTQTPIPPTSTNTPVPPTATATRVPPTATPFSLRMPVGTPVSEWRGLPIMPGAIAGEETDTGAYIFTINASLDDIQNFYELELRKLGWKKTSGGAGVPGLNYIANFKLKDDSIILMLIAIDQQTTYVLLGEM
jgi:hypothetical protein